MAAAIDPNLLVPPWLREIIGKVYLDKLKVLDSNFGTLDENWIDEYRVYYSKLDANPSAIRLFYGKPKSSSNESKSNSIFGFVNVTPYRGTTKFSEMYLPPPSTLNSNGKKNEVFVTCILPYSKYGYNVQCVPFISPDGVISICLHGSIWILLQHLSVFSKGVVKGLTLPEIQKLASGNYFSDGIGLSFPNKAVRIIKMSDCGVFNLDSTRRIDRPEKRYTEKEMERILYSYIESRLPVVLGVDANKLPWWSKSSKSKNPRYHAIVCIGHTMKRGKIDGYVFHDQSTFPYQILATKQLLKAWKLPESGSDSGKYTMQAVVGVPPAVTIRYEIAEIVASKVFKILKSNKELKRRIGLRPSLIRRAQVEKFLGQNKALEKVKSKINIPSWVWAFFFFYTPSQRIEGKCTGFFMLDATTSMALPPTFAIISIEKTVYLIDKERKSRRFVIEGDELIEKTS
jgi:hypothetical protein